MRRRKFDVREPLRFEARFDGSDATGYDLPALVVTRVTVFAMITSSRSSTSSTSAPDSAARQRAVVWPLRDYGTRARGPRRRARVFRGVSEGQREQNQKKRGSRARRVVTKSRGDLAINTQLLLVKGERFQP